MEANGHRRAGRSTLGYFCQVCLLCWSGCRQPLSPYPGPTSACQARHSTLEEGQGQLSPLSRFCLPWMFSGLPSTGVWVPLGKGRSPSGKQQVQGEADLERALQACPRTPDLFLCFPWLRRPMREGGTERGPWTHSKAWAGYCGQLTGRQKWGPSGPATQVPCGGPGAAAAQAQTPTPRYGCAPDFEPHGCP